MHIGNNLSKHVINYSTLRHRRKKYMLHDERFVCLCGLYEKIWTFRVICIWKNSKKVTQNQYRYICQNYLFWYMHRNSKFAYNYVKYFVEICSFYVFFQELLWCILWYFEKDIEKIELRFLYSNILCEVIYNSWLDIF